MWRARRVRRDREAGLVFDWRTGHGSTSRLIVAAFVSVSFWGAVCAYVQIRGSEASPVRDQQISLTVIDLDSGHPLAEFLNREALFHDRWDVSSHELVDREVSRILEDRSAPRYSPQVHEIAPPKRQWLVESLPGMGPEVLPPPEEIPEVEFATPPIKWWVTIESVQGAGEFQPISFEWPEPKDQMSEGEVWTLLAGVDWEGRVLTCSAWEEADDARTPLIISRCRSVSFPALEEPGPLRWWKLQARVENRPISE